MECHKTNSSLDTLLIIDHEEEIKSEKHLNHSSFDKLTVSCEKLQRNKHRHHQSKSEQRSRSRKQRKRCADRVRTKFVTQEIHIEQQNSKCIINLNTTVYNHKNEREKSCEAKSSDAKSKFKERPVPHCLRQLCSRRGHHNIRFHSYSKNHSKTNSHKRTRCLNRVQECTEKSKQGNYNYRQHSRHEKKPIKELTPKYNDSKIIFPKKQLELTYEDISTTSLDSYLDVPISYKHVANYSTGEQYESKLDTLIKRTKERERKLVEQSRNIPWYTSTPAYTEVSSVDFPVSCSDVSIHSRSTLILEPREHGYSPSIEGLCHSPTIERYYQYSPKHTIGSHLLPKISENNDFELKIKMEPSMEIGAYSPTQSPYLKEFDTEQWIQNEIKVEPKIEK